MIIERRKTKNCPRCGYHLLARKDDEIICLSTACNWSTNMKRETDKDLADIVTLQRDWN